MIHEPISVMLVGPPGIDALLEEHDVFSDQNTGSDGWLIELIKGTLVASGRPLRVETGKDVFKSKS